MMRPNRKHCFAMLAVAVFASGAPVVAQTFSPQASPPPAPVASIAPACTTGLTASVGRATVAHGVGSELVTVSRRTGDPCVIADFPALAFASHPLHQTLATGRLGLPSSATLDPQTQITFSLRYVFAPHRSPVACALTATIGGVALGGLPLPIAPCQAVSEIDVSSFAPRETSALPSPSATTATRERLRSCGVHDLGVRDVAGEAAGGVTREIVAVQNRSFTPCAIARSTHAALLESQGQLMAVGTAPLGPASVTRGAFALPAGREASLTLSFGTVNAHGMACRASQAVALVLPGGTFTASAPARLAPCAGGDGFALRQTPLRLGVPLLGFEW